MFGSLTIASSSILIASIGFAQQTMHAERVPSPLKDAGVFHMATGTWTRGGQHENLGPKVLYANTANTGFFGVMGVAADLIWTDEGRIPSTGGHANATADSYLVNGFTLAYCSSTLGVPQNGGIAFYDQYTSCTDPASLSAVAAFTLLLPGGGSCWLVTFDFTGTSLEWTMNGDADGTFDGTSALDNFGWTLFLADQGTGGFNGPFLNGDPNNYAYGDGTYYQNSGATYATGLATVDQFWLTDSTFTYANGCYWFGGYTGGNPFASFWLTLYGEGGDKGCLDSLSCKYCAANANSTGAPADIASSGGNSASSGTVSMLSAPVPNQPGIFFHAANQAQAPFGCSFLCATGNVIRGAVITGAGNLATYTYDNSDAKHSLGAFAGQTRSFQYWYRDPMNSANCGGATFNTSNAVSGTITP